MAGLQGRAGLEGDGYQGPRFWVSDGQNSVHLPSYDLSVEESIENKVHWVQDVTFDEDRSQVRCGSIPQVMAAFRNTIIGLMHWAGETNIAAA